MTFREKTTIRILFLIARWLAPSEWRAEIKSIDTHVSVNLQEVQ